MGASRADKEQYFIKLRQLLDTYRAYMGYLIMLVTDFICSVHLRRQRRQCWF